MVPGELACLAREHRRAERKQDLGLAQAAWVQQELARRWIAGLVLVAELEVEVAERDPACLAAPAGLDELGLERQHRAEPGAGFRRPLCLQAGRKA